MPSQRKPFPKSKALINYARVRACRSHANVERKGLLSAHSTLRISRNIYSDMEVTEKRVCVCVCSGMNVCDCPSWLKWTLGWNGSPQVLQSHNVGWPNLVLHSQGGRHAVQASRKINRWLNNVPSLPRPSSAHTFHFNMFPANVIICFAWFATRVIPTDMMQMDTRQT